jgi:hypothetical protein
VEQTWDLWFPSAGATGVSFARALVGEDPPTDRVLVHAAPPRLDVTVRDDDGNVVAEGLGLDRGAPGPITFLIRDGREIRLEDGWPSDRDLGRLVILPGGEAGVLKAWWHAEDHSAWRWQVELSNHT